VDDGGRRHTCPVGVSVGRATTSHDDEPYSTSFFFSFFYSFFLLLTLLFTSLVLLQLGEPGGVVLTHPAAFAGEGPKRGTRYFYQRKESSPVCNCTYPARLRLSLCIVTGRRFADGCIVDGGRSSGIFRAITGAACFSPCVQSEYVRATRNVSKPEQAYCRIDCMCTSKRDILGTLQTADLRTRVGLDFQRSKVAMLSS
jgi:hypothetical protein